MKSLCRSAPFWNTESGINTVGLPEAEMVAGASLFKDLSSNLRIFSTREGMEWFGAAEWFGTDAGIGSLVFEGKESGTEVEVLEGAGLMAGEEEEALLVCKGELDLGGKTVRFSVWLEGSSVTDPITVISDLGIGTVPETISNSISVSTVVDRPAAESCWTVWLEQGRGQESVEGTEAFERAERLGGGMEGDRAGN